MVERNESVQAKFLEVEANRRKAQGEYGVFEPEFVTSATRESNKRQNTALQQSSSAGIKQFDEHNNVYETGLEALLPSGAKARIGYSLRDLRNSLQPIYLSRGVADGEYQTFMGITLSQPLLKNGWFKANFASIRLAALASDIAFQDYRRQLMLVLSTAQASYWNLYLSQQQVEFFGDSVATAEKILKDNQERLRAGIGSELDVLEAQAGIALRKSKLSDAEQKLLEAANRVTSYYAETAFGEEGLVRAVDRPQVAETNYSFYEAWRTAYTLNPDYLMQRKKALQESVRVSFARNQRMPELNVKGSYGLNGLGNRIDTSWESIRGTEWPSWSVGLELRISVGGGVKSRNELGAARMREEAAMISLHEVETQISNAIDTAMHKIRSSRDSIRSYQTVVDFNKQLLDAALARLEVGKIESRKVLTIESDLFEARNSVVEALAQYQRSVLEFDLMAGTVLQRRNLEITQKQLEDKTNEFLRRRLISEKRVSSLIKSAREKYDQAVTDPETPEMAGVRKELEAKLASLPLKPAAGQKTPLSAPPADAGPQP